MALFVLEKTIVISIFLVLVTVFFGVDDMEGFGREDSMKRVFKG